MLVVELCKVEFRNTRWDYSPVEAHTVKKLRTGEILCWRFQKENTRIENTSTRRWWLRVSSNIHVTMRPFTTWIAETWTRSDQGSTVSSLWQCNEEWSGNGSKTGNLPHSDYFYLFFFSNFCYALKIFQFTSFLNWRWYLCVS